MNRDRSPAMDDSQSGDRRPWRLVHGDGGGPDPSAAIRPDDGPTNMAIDVALLESVKAGGAPVLRLYRWDPACLSFGRNQPTRGRYDAAAAADRGIDLVRRPTGGQAVLHDDELTYAVIARVSVIGKPRAAYRRINEALVDGLGRLGVAAMVAGSESVAVDVDSGGETGVAAPPGGPDWDAACFRRPERGEVVVGGAKLVGSAQRMESRTILQHGSILVGGSQAAAEELLMTAVRQGATPPGVPVAAPTSAAPTPPGSPGWTTLDRELGGRPGLDALATAVEAGFQAVFGAALAPSSLSPVERDAVERLREKFGADEWTWRR